VFVGGRPVAPVYSYELRVNGTHVLPWGLEKKGDAVCNVRDRSQRSVLDKIPRRVAFSPKGRYFAVCFEDAKIEIFETGKRTSVSSIKTAHKVNALALSPDENLLAFGGEGEYVGVWDIRKQKVVRRLACGSSGEERVTTLRFAPNGRFLACGGGDELGENVEAIEIEE
jgi:WD40 repeat protein